MSGFGTSSFGSFGGILVPTSTPGTGYGGVGFFAGAVPTPAPPAGGYGGTGYGTGSYGSVGLAFGSVTSAVSINGFQIEVFFSQEVIDDADLRNPVHYAFTPVLGAAPAAPVAAEPGVAGTGGGYTSVILTHTGTTLGGLYDLEVNNVRTTLGGVIVPPGNIASNILTFGDPPAYTASALDASSVLLDFDQDMLPVGLNNPDQYTVTTSYPLPLQVLAATFPRLGDSSQVELSVGGMTGAEYTVSLGPSLVVGFYGDELPTDSTTFASTAVGVGTSTVVGSNLVMQNLVGNSYGWRLTDTQARLVPGSTFDASVSVDLSTATIAPAPLDGSIADFTVSDGSVQVTLSLAYQAGTEIVEIRSGAYNVFVPLNWSSGVRTLGVVRNQQAGTFTFLVDGAPIFSNTLAFFLAPSLIGSSAQFELNPLGVAAITNAQLLELEVSATSETVFSEAWNFLHDHFATPLAEALPEDLVGEAPPAPGFSFVGLPGDTVAVLRTACGPLVRGWGDGRPATPQDVTVRVGELEVEVASVNPYLGEITLAVPLPAGTPNVSVDYQWFDRPAFPLLLNTPGLVLNQVQGLESPKPVVGASYGFGDGSINAAPPFQYSVVLGVETPAETPKRISHRYLGFDAAYSAVLGDPNSLLLNAYSKPPALETVTEGTSLVFTGEALPSASGWDLQGLDNTTESLQEDNPDPTFEEGLYPVDAQGEEAIWYQDVAREDPSVVSMSARFQVDAATFEGVFTGVGYGVSTNHHLYLVGALEVNGLRHLGLLKDSDSSELSSWDLAGSTDTTSQVGGSFVVSSLPDFVLRECVESDVTQRVQILEGDLAGVYTVTSITEVGYTYRLFVSEALPEGSVEATIFFEIDWGTLRTTRLQVDNDLKRHPQGKATLFLGGSEAGELLSLEGSFPSPSDFPLRFPEAESLYPFFGHVLDTGTTYVRWSEVRMDNDPGLTYGGFQEKVVQVRQGALPDAQTNNVWYQAQTFGFGQVDAGTGSNIIASNSRAETVDYSFGYSRKEPTLTASEVVDIDVQLQVEGWSQGTMDAVVMLQDGQKQVLFSTIAYTESGAERALAGPLGSLSASGLQTLSAEGWTYVGTSLTETVSEDLLTLSQAEGFTSTYSHVFDETLSRDLTVRAEVTSGSVLFTMDVGSVGVGVRVSAADVTLYDVASGVDVVSYATSGSGQQLYRVRVDQTTATVVVLYQGAVLGTSSLGDFTATASTSVVTVQFLSGTTMVLDSLSLVERPGADVLYTLGVWKGGAVSDIRNWELPRTDALALDNASLSAQVQQMDWTSSVQVRIRRDPTWGVTVLRPDMSLPPYFDGTYASELVRPSAGWINVETAELPNSTEETPEIAFGPLYGASISLQRWYDVRYRVYRKTPRTHRKMVLNQYNVLNSGERLKDKDPEVLVLDSISNTMLSLKGGGIFAERVFSLQYTNLQGVATLLNPDSFTFDVTSQTVTLNDGLAFHAPLTLLDVQSDPAEEGDEGGFAPLEEPDEPVRVPVTVTFAAGDPVTETYLKTQPFEQGQTKLATPTPSFAHSWVSDQLRTEVFGDVVQDPTDISGDPDTIDNTSYPQLGYTEGGRLVGAEFFEISNNGQDGHLAVFSDSSAKGGIVSMVLEDTTTYQETFPPFVDAVSGVLINALTGVQTPVTF